MTSTIVNLNRRAAFGGEQASGLRDLVARRNASQEVHPATKRNCQTVVVAGGKGGVGRSVIALNLAILFAQRGDSVGLVDAAAGLGNIELLCGLNGYWNLSHVVHGCRALDDVVLTGPAGIKILSGASCLADRSASHKMNANRLREQLQSYEQSLDWLIVDGSGGSANLAVEFARSADDLLIVTTPEPTAIAEAYSSVKSFAGHCSSRIGLLVNQADSASQANQILDRIQQASQAFLQRDLLRRGFIPRDAAINTSVNERVPVVIQSPDSPATTELSRLVERWTRTRTTVPSNSYFARWLQ